MLKKFVSFCLLLSMIVTGIFQSGALIINADTAGGTSGKIGVISSIASTSYGEGNNAAKAFDGDSSTRWTSALSLNDTTKNQQYLQAVLPDDTSIERIDITWYTPWVDEYEIRISDDGERWQSVLTSSVTEKGIDNGKEGAAYLSQKDTFDVLSGVTAKYLQIAMTDVNYPGAESYLSVVDVSIYASDAEDRLTILSADTGDLGSYGDNTANKMINGTTDTAGDRWTSTNISMNKAQILAGAIEFTFADPVNLTRFDVDWFNTPLSAYSLEAARADGTYTMLVDAKAMPASDMSVGVDALTHTIDCFKDLTEITGIRLTFDDTNAENNMYLSICEVRAYGSLSEEPDPWEINLMPEGASASASSVQSGGMEAQKAIDRIQSTRWASSFGEQPSWLLIDLGETLSFDQMKLYQEAAYGKAYDIEVSLDGSTYTPVYETDGGQVGTNDIYFGDEINARYVRINFTEYGAYTAYSIWEAELFKNGAQRMFEMAESQLFVPSKISTDFVLPTMAQNMKVAWSADSNLLQIDEEGNVTVTTPEENAAVTLTASLTYGEETKEIIFESTVLSEDNREVDYEIYPVPQNMMLGEEGNVDLDKEINVVLAADLQDDTVLKNRIEEVFTENGYTLTYSDAASENGTDLLVGVNGDGSLADTYADDHGISKAVFDTEDKYDKHIVSLDEHKTILVLAESADAAYYGFATLDLMFETAQSDDFFGNSSTRMTTVLIEDYADMQYRGVIEGFYGWPWSLEDRLSFTEFAKRYKFNYYAYGPKSDPYHLSKWNEEYPTEAAITDEERTLGVMTQEDFRTLIEACDNSNIDFVWSVHPAMGANKIDFNDPQSIADGEAKIMEKYASMYELGVRQFGLFVDDIDLNVAYRNRVAIADLVDDLQNSLYTNWGSALADPNDEDAVRPLMFVPSHYFLSFGDSAQNEAAIRELSRVHEDVIITFTGYGCWSNVVEADAKTFAERAGRDPMFWWNYSTNDVMDDQLFTEKADSYYAMNKDVDSLYGFISNPMNEAELSKISLFGIADYAWNVADFDSARDYDAYFALEFSDEPLAAAYQNVAVNLDKNGKSLSSEKTLMNQVLSEYQTDGVCDRAKLEQLRVYAQDLMDSLETVEQMKSSQHAAYRNLYDEMLPWLNKLRAMADMTLDLCDVLEDPASADAWDLYAAQLLQLDAFETDDAYAFTSLELNVSNAQASYLRNAVSPNDPLCNFLTNMNMAMKKKLSIVREPQAAVITNVAAYEDLPITDTNGTIALPVDVLLSQNEYVGIALERIFDLEVDLRAFTDAGLRVEYSLNGKEWTTEASEGFAYVRVINPTTEKISVSGTITLTNDQPDAAATTNMVTYSNYAIGNVVDGDKATKFWKGANQAAGDYIQIEYVKTFDLHNLNFYFISSNGMPSDVPQEAIVEVSADGSEWHMAGTIHIGDLTADTDGLYSYTINGIDQQVRCVRYRVTSPTSNVWFQLAEVTVNEGIELPQATVSGKALENVGDGDVTTYSTLTAEEELHYQVIENADVSEISVLALSDLSEELNAQVFIYASKTNYPYQNEWIELGTLNGSHTLFDVSAYDNLQQIVVANLGEGLNVFEISVSGDAYIDDAKLNALVDTAIDRLTKLQGMDISDNTLSSVKRFEEELLAVQEALYDYENETDVQAILTMLEESTQLLVEKGDSEELESVYANAAALNERYYTEESYAVLKLALQQAQTLLENADDSDQIAMDAMVKKIDEALDGLQYRPADYTAVDEAIERAESLNKADYKDFSTVEEAIAAVERGLDIRHQPDVDQMAQDILDAVNTLEKITGGQPDISGDHGGEDAADTSVVEQSGIYAGIALMAAVMLAVLKKRKDSAEN